MPLHIREDGTRGSRASGCALGRSRAPAADLGGGPTGFVTATTPPSSRSASTTGPLARHLRRGCRHHRRRRRLGRLARPRPRAERGGGGGRGRRRRGAAPLRGHRRLGTSLLAFPKDVVAALKAAIGAELLAKYATRSTCGVPSSPTGPPLGGQLHAGAAHVHGRDDRRDRRRRVFVGTGPAIKKATSERVRQVPIGAVTLDALPTPTRCRWPRQGQQVVRAPLFLYGCADPGPRPDGDPGDALPARYAARFDRDAKTVALAARVRPGLGDISDICAGCGTDSPAETTAQRRRAGGGGGGGRPRNTALQPSGIGGGARRCSRARTPCRSGGCGCALGASRRRRWAFAL